VSGSEPHEEDETMTFEIHRSDGRVTRHDSYTDALETCEAEWGEDVEIGHDGDLTDGGDRTLVWRDEASSIDDDGAHAVASIVRATAR
jgi:hypothetical protein